jgi:hypothetical protein
MLPFYDPLKSQGNSLMRTALASLLAAAAFVSAAQAQTPAPPTAPAAQPATPPAPPATTPAAPGATAAQPAPTTTAPGAPAPPAPGATATPAAPTAEAPPTLPTSGDGATIISLVEKVCVPLVRGGNLDDIAKANAATFGFKKNRRDNSWTMPLGTGNKDYNITLYPSGSNKDVCRGEVHYAVNEDKPIVSAINIWSFLHQPELVLQANYVAVDPDGIKRVRKSWEHFDANASTAINFSTWTKPDDTSLNGKYSTGEIYYQERKLSQ